MKKKKAKRAGASRALRQEKKKKEKLRVGYLCADLGEGRTRDLLPPFFSAYDRLHFEVYAYHTGTGGDTAVFSESAVLREVGACTPAAAAECIRADRIDLLVDLSLCTPDAFACSIMELRPAPCILSLADQCPPALADVLPAVEGARVLPFAYAPLQPVHTYTARTPLLDTGGPAIGFAGRLDGADAVLLVQLLTAFLSEMDAVHLVMPAEIAAGMTEEALAAITACGTERSSLTFVDVVPYEELDLVLGIGADFLDVCRAAEWGVPLLTAQELLRDGYAAALLAHLGIPAADSIAAAAAAAASLCADLPRLSRLHELLHWQLMDCFDAGAVVFSVERAYMRALMRVTEETAEGLSARLMHAEEARDWPLVIAAAHRLDGMEMLTPAQRMTLAWAYYFSGALMYAGRWARAAEGVSEERLGARLYLSVISPVPIDTPMETYKRAQEGLARIAAGLPAVPEVRTLLLKICADNGMFAEEPNTAQYALDYAAATDDIFMRRCYYGAALFKLNAVDVPAAEVYRTSLGYGGLFDEVQPYTHAGRRRKEKIRIGYISGDFCHHVMQYFIWPFLAGFDSDAFEVYAYSLGKKDQFADFFRTLVTVWRDVSDSKRDPERIARMIYEDEVDILFDLAGHTADSGLAALAWKPAPVQLSGLGYMATTGLPAVDYFVTDRYCDPEGSGSEAFYTEKLLRLTSQFCYNGFTSLPASTGTPARTRGYIQFVSFNQYAKLQDETLHAWRTIMERVPGARLLLKNRAYGKSGVAVMAHERLRRLGFDMSRVAFEAATRSYMERYLDADIALDTFPWPGGGTSCDALYMGVPVVSRYTARHSTRFTYSLLANIGLAELASERIEDYIETAVALAGDLDLLDALHRTLRARMQASPVMDQERYIREMEGYYREIWSAWEAGQQGV
ncbi:hypothetical protein [uncultured Selenomonas sp.]|uniref:O-linked N-acetylglucosamine transferase, SPINDLY family protein n=1 Tax=uncultured Selenomonas sp. TaxID=159275 RepID=UPI0028D34600|nr:hypothetical protein [uncultured Selenomonas sp.]